MSVKKPRKITRRRGGASVLCHCGRATRVLRTERTGNETLRTRRCTRGHRFRTTESRC